MASVNLTCVDCAPARPCLSCRAIGRTLRAAGHAVTQTSRYDALRAAMVGRYGFDACILPVGDQERSVVDASASLLAKTRVGIVAHPGMLESAGIPSGFTVIPVMDWQQHPFPTEWISAPRATPANPTEDDSTRVVRTPAETFEHAGVAKRRLKSLAARAQRELGSAGFSDDRLDPLAALEDEIAWAAASASGFGLVLAIVPAKSHSQPAGIERALTGLREIAKTVVRTSDAIAQGRESLLLIVSEAQEPDIAAVATRFAHHIRRAVKDSKTEKQLARAFRHVTIGVSAYPTHGISRETLLARATAAAKPVL